MAHKPLSNNDLRQSCFGQALSESGQLRRLRTELVNSQNSSAAGISVWCLAVVFLLVNQGCSVPYASEKLAHQPDDNPPTKDVLSAADQNEIEGAYVESTGGKAAGSPPRPSLVVRWSDVPMAVVYACDEAEMAVVEADVGDEVCRYRLVTVEDWPATLLVTRINDGRVYQASATVGAFGDRTERAARLLEALEAQLKEFANKRKFE